VGFCFATCDINRALVFINKMYPSYKDLTKEDVPLLSGLIEKDVLRVQDPNFHQPCQIIAGNQYSKEYDAEINKAIEEFLASLTPLD